MDNQEYKKQYEEKVIEVIKKAGKWLIYYEKTPYLIDIVASLSKLEKLIKEIE